MWTPQLKHHNLPVMHHRLSLFPAKLIGEVAEHFVANEAKKLIKHEADKFIAHEVKRIKHYEKEKVAERRLRVDEWRAPGNHHAEKHLLTDDKSKVRFTPVKTTNGKVFLLL